MSAQCLVRAVIRPTAPPAAINSEPKSFIVQSGPERERRKSGTSERLRLPPGPIDKEVSTTNPAAKTTMRTMTHDRSMVERYFPARSRSLTL